MTSRASEGPRCCGALSLTAIAVVAIAAMGLFQEDRNLSSAPLAPTETVTRFELVIDGEPVQCERREDHMRGTVETAC